MLSVYTDHCTLSDVYWHVLLSGHFRCLKSPCSLGLGLVERLPGDRLRQHCLRFHLSSLHTWHYVSGTPLKGRRQDVPHRQCRCNHPSIRWGFPCLSSLQWATKFLHTSRWLDCGVSLQSLGAFQWKLLEHPCDWSNMPILSYAQCFSRTYPHYYS